MADFYVVTGTLDLDATGDYFYMGVHNTKPYYRRAEEAHYYIWWETHSWYISFLPGATQTFYWQRTDSNIVGQYVPRLAASGTATVAEGFTPYQIPEDWSF